MSSMINSRDEIDLFEIFNVLVKHIKMVMVLSLVFTCVIFVVVSSFVPEKSFETTLSYPSQQLSNVIPNAKDLFLSKKQLERYLAKPAVRAAVFPAQWNDKKQEWIAKEKSFEHPAGVPTIIDLQRFLKNNIVLQQDQLIIKWKTQTQYKVLKAYFDESLSTMLSNNTSMLSSMKGLDPNSRMKLAKFKAFTNDPIIETAVIEYSKRQLLLISVLLALILSIGYVIGCEVFNAVQSRRT